VLFAQPNVLQHSLLHAMKPDPDTSPRVVGGGHTSRRKLTVLHCIADTSVIGYEMIGP